MKLNQYRIALAFDHIFLLSIFQSNLKRGFRCHSLLH